MSVINKLRKRAFYPFKLVNGETVHLRGLTIKQLADIEPFRNEREAAGFAIGCALLEESAEPAFVKSESESDKEFGARVLEETDMPFDVYQPLVEHIFKLSTNPSEHAAEAIVKN